METRQSLLKSAKANAQSDAWFELFSIYEPLIAGWIARSGVEESMIDDLTQEVLNAVAVELPSFEHNGRTGAFRRWLKLIAINRCRRYWDRKKQSVHVERSFDSDSGIDILDQLEDPGSALSQLWNHEHDRYVLDRMIDIAKREFDSVAFEAFHRNTVRGESASDISEKLGITIGQVYKIKHRVLTRLRQVADGLIDDIQL